MFGRRHERGHSWQCDGIRTISQKSRLLSIHHLCVTRPPHLLSEVSRVDHVDECLSSSLASHHGGVDALSSEGVDVAGGVSNDEEVVVDGGGQALRGRLETHVRPTDRAFLCSAPHLELPCRISA